MYEQHTYTLTNTPTSLLLIQAMYQRILEKPCCPPWYMQVQNLPVNPFVRQFTVLDNSESYPVLVSAQRTDGLVSELLTSRVSRGWPRGTLLIKHFPICL